MGRKGWGRWGGLVGVLSCLGHEISFALVEEEGRWPIGMEHLSRSCIEANKR